MTELDLTSHRRLHLLPGLECQFLSADRLELHATDYKWAERGLLRSERPGLRLLFNVYGLVLLE